MSGRLGEAEGSFENFTFYVRTAALPPLARKNDALLTVRCVVQRLEHDSADACMGNI